MHRVEGTPPSARVDGHAHLAVVDQHPVPELFRNPIRRSWVEGGSLLLGDLLHLPIELRSRRLWRR